MKTKISIHSLCNIASPLRMGTMIMLCLFCLSTVAQPPARRAAEQQKKEAKVEKNAGSAYRDFPVAQTMPEDAAWRRDIYRTLDLKKDANAVLYYPTVPQDGRMNLFTFLFKAILRGQINAYDYTLDGNENFSEANRVRGKELMDRFGIFYETKEGKMRVNDADLPSADVTVYFIKESVYYDQHTASFRNKVIAICPVLKAAGDFGTEEQKPMFWVKYEDIASQLNKLILMGSNYNNAASMSANDYFTLNRYEGDIYKTTNLQDRVLISEHDNDSTLKAEQRRIERQIVDLQDRVWGRDSVAMAKKAAEQAAADSLAAVEKASKKKTSSRSVSSRRSAGKKTADASANDAKDDSKKEAQKATTKREKKTKVKKAKTPKASSGNGYSVRRQRR